ncbi:MAG: sodium:alanine symporter family protein, partial [Clostridia bacterium]|nr:sodium:alanine symporter family protein [Clostridia bacterium]
ISSAIRYGFTRGLLSNEAGCGTATIAHASSSLSPHSQGCLGIFEVFWDTIVLCFVTALVILIADTGEQNPILLAINSYGKLLGNFGRFFIAFSCILFALATVSCQFYYGSTSLRFLSRSRFAFLAYSAIFFSVCVISAIISSATMWQISDLVVASLAIFNLIFLVVLAKEIK